MFKQLQKSFVKSAMLSFTAVLLVVLVAVNVVNYRQTVTQVDRLATMLVENDGIFPDAPEGGWHLKNILNMDFQKEWSFVKMTKWQPVMQS